MHLAELRELDTLDITANPIRSEFQGFTLPSELIDLSFPFLLITVMVPCGITLPQKSFGVFFCSLHTGGVIGGVCEQGSTDCGNTCLIRWYNHFGTGLLGLVIKIRDCTFGFGIAGEDWLDWRIICPCVCLGSIHLMR
jgi:hypothetical protein